MQSQSSLSKHNPLSQPVQSARTRTRSFAQLHQPDVPEDLQNRVRFGVLTLGTNEIQNGYLTQLARLRRQRPFRELRLVLSPYKPIPAEFSQIARLAWVQTLAVSAHALQVEHIEQIAQLTRLRDLELSCGFLDDSIVRPIAKLGRLRHLKIGHGHTPRFTGAGLVHFRRLNELRSLDLSNCWIHQEESGMRHLAWLSKLQRLNLSSTHIAGTGLKYLSGLSQLRWLNLSATKIKNRFLAHLAELRRLEYLGLACNDRISDAGIACLSTLRRLQTLDLRYTEGVGDACLQYLPRNVIIVS